MARITVEDCVKIISNRFELCIIASNRAKAILSGSQTQSNSDEKAAVISLREIADGNININEVKKNIVKNIKESSSSKNNNLDNNSKEKILDAFAQESESNKISQEPSPNFISDNLDVED
jgi:DNA-directed RNA polymerase subunit omega